MLIVFYYHSLSLELTYLSKLAVQQALVILLPLPTPSTRITSVNYHANFFMWVIVVRTQVLMIVGQNTLSQLSQLSSPSRIFEGVNN